MSSIRMAGLGAFITAGAITLTASASMAMPGSVGALSVGSEPVQLAACMVDDGGGRMRSCDTLGGGAFKGKKTKGHAKSTAKPNH